MSDGTIGFIGVIGCVALLAVAIVGSLQEENEWTTFRSAHHCKVVGKTAASTSVGVGIGADGKTSVVPIFTPGQTGYACDDGVTYWRQ
jgi:hypothetical protein